MSPKKTDPANGFLVAKGPAERTDVSARPCDIILRSISRAGVARWTGIDFRRRCANVPCWERPRFQHCVDHLPRSLLSKSVLSSALESPQFDDKSYRSVYNSYPDCCAELRCLPPRTFALCSLARHEETHVVGHGFEYSACRSVYAT